MVRNGAAFPTSARPYAVARSDVSFIVVQTSSCVVSTTVEEGKSRPVARPWMARSGRAAPEAIRLYTIRAWLLSSVTNNSSLSVSTQIEWKLGFGSETTLKGTGSAARARVDGTAERSATD